MAKYKLKFLSPKDKLAGLEKLKDKEFYVFTILTQDFTNKKVRHNKKIKYITPNVKFIALKLKDKIKIDNKDNYFDEIISTDNILKSIYQYLKDKDNKNTYFTYTFNLHLIHPGYFYYLKDYIDKENLILYYNHDYMDIKTKSNKNPVIKPGFAPDWLAQYDYIKYGVIFNKNILNLIDIPEENNLLFHQYIILSLSQNKNVNIIKSDQIEYTVLDKKQKDFYDYFPEDKSHIHNIKKYSQVLNIPIDSITELDKNVYYIRYKIIKPQRFLIIVPFKDKPELLRNLTQSLLTATYDNYQVILVDNNSKEEKTFEEIEKLKSELPDNFIFDKLDIPFNWAKINNWAFNKYAKENDYILFLNNDTKVITPDFMEKAAEYLQRDDVGALGAKLYFPNNTIQHSFVVFTGRYQWGPVDHVYRLVNKTNKGYLYNLILPINVMMVTGAALFTKYSVFKELNGFDERFRINYNDIDYALRVYYKGYKVIAHNQIEFYHYESVSRGRGFKTKEAWDEYQSASNLFLNIYGRYSPDLVYSNLFEFNSAKKIYFKPDYKKIKEMKV